MSNLSLLRLALLPLLAAPAISQLPQPATTLRAAPRASWVAVSATGTPTQRRDNPGAASNDKMYVFGGSDGNANTTVHNALYEFDGTAWTLKTADTSAPGFPTARGRACVAWNFATNKLVVFGGDTGTGLVGGPVVPVTLLGDTWEWDPVTNTWTDVTPVSGSPSPRRWAAMTWDPVTGGMLMFGGDAVLSPVTPNSETWLWLGGVWTQLAPATVPPARTQHSLVTRADSFNDVLMCGGLDESFTLTTDKVRYVDVWTWNGADWTKISDYDFVTQTGTVPAGANANQAVYDPLRKRVVLQGGQGLSAGTFTSSAASGVPTNTTYLYGYFNSGTGQWEQYNGSPTNWTSEFDCLTNQWTIYSRKNTVPALATWNELDPVIGRLSRYFAAYVPALGKIYKVSGQPNGGTTGTASYQANPIAVADPYGTGCSGPGGTLAMAADDLPWNGRTFSVTGTGFGAAPSSVAVLMLSAVGSLPPGAVTLASLAPIVPGGGPGCDLLIQTLDYSEGLLPSAGTATWSLPLPDATVDPTLPGVTFYVQFAELVFAPFPSNWVGTYASNGITCTVGAL